MLSYQEVNLNETVLRIISFIHLFPHEFEKERNKDMKVTKDPFKLFLTYLNCFISLFYGTFLAVRLLPINGFGYSSNELKSPNFEILLHFFWTSVHLTDFTIQFFSIQHRDELAILYNFLRRFNQGKVLSPIHSWPTFGIFFIFETLLTARASLTNAFYLAFGYFYVMSFYRWLKYACSEWILHGKKSKTDSDEDLIIKIYRSLTIMNAIYNASFSKSFIPFNKTCIEALGIITIYGSIRFINSLSIGIYLTLPLVGIFCTSQSMIVVSLLAIVNSESLKMLSNLKYMLHKRGDKIKVTRRIFNSCQELRCKVGSLYFIEKKSKLKLGGIIFDSVVNLLIATK